MQALRRFHRTNSPFLRAPLWAIHSLFILAFVSATAEWNTASGQPRDTLVVGKERITAICISTDGKRLAAGDFKGRVKVWELPSKKLLYTLETNEDWLKAIAFVKDQHLVTCSIGVTGAPHACLWNLPTGGCMKSTFHSNDCSFLGLTSDAKFLAYQIWVYQFDQQDKENMIYFADPMEQPFKFKFGTGKKQVTVAEFSPDGSMFAAGSKEGMIRIWDLNKKKELRSIRGSEHGVAGLAFSPNNTALASVFNFGDMKIWEISTGQALSAWNQNGNPPIPLVFSRDNKYLGVGLGNPWFWEWKVKKTVAKLECNSVVTTMMISPDGETLIVGTYAGEVTLWESPNGKNYK